MAYNPFIQQVGGGTLQGSAGYLQGGTNSLQGSAPAIQGNPPTPKPAYGSPGVTTPTTKKQQYINDLSSRYGQVGSTIFDKSTGTGFTNAQDFFNSAGVKSFDNLKFDTAYNPTGQVAPTPAPASPANNLAQLNANIPTAPQTDPMAAFKTAYTDYIKSLAPSADVTKAKQAYLDHVTNAKLGISNLEGQGRGIPLALVRGQQEKLSNQAQIEAERLQGDIDIAQGTQSQMSAEAKARADFESTLYGSSKADQANAQKFAYENNITTPFYTVGGTVYRTSDGKAFASQGEAFGAGVARDYSNAPTISKPKAPLTLSEGEAVFDPVTGQFVVKNPKTYDPNAGGASLGALGLNSTQASLFNNIVTKYNASPLIAASDRTIVLKNAADAINADPGNATKQLNLVYSYIQALDTYQSAVREGELALAQSLDSRINNLRTEVEKVQSGKVVSANVAREIAGAAKALVDTINQGARQKAQSYQSQAQVMGLGDAWNQYIGGFNPSYGGGGGATGDPLGLGFNTVGNTKASTPYLKTLGAITGENGSSLWKYGLDVDLKIGDPVKSPVYGKVIFADSNGGFGNQVKIQTADGREIWLSHLDSGKVKLGQTVYPGQIIGIGGKTGNTIAGKGGDGSHLDITMKDKNGKLLSAQQVKQYLSKIYV